MGKLVYDDKKIKILTSNGFNSINLIAKATGVKIFILDVKNFVYLENEVLLYGDQVDCDSAADQIDELIRRE